MQEPFHRLRLDKSQVINSVTMWKPVGKIKLFYAGHKPGLLPLFSCAVFYSTRSHKPAFERGDQAPRTMKSQEDCRN